MLYLRMILFVVAFWFSSVNFINTSDGQDVPAINFVIQGAAIAGLIATYGFFS